MEILINTSLVTVALISALTAIGGRTWREEESLPIHRRITARGWVALVCIVLTFCLGLTKHLYDSAALAATERSLEKQYKLLDSTNLLLATTLEGLTAANKQVQVQTDQMKKIEERRLAEESARKAAEDRAFSEAKKNIEWAIKLGGRKTYLAARGAGKTPYEAALIAQTHNPSVQKLIEGFGVVRTNEYVASIGE